MVGVADGHAGITGWGDGNNAIFNEIIPCMQKWDRTDLHLVYCDNFCERWVMVAFCVTWMDGCLSKQGRQREEMDNFP